MSRRNLRLHWAIWHPTPYNDFLFRSLASDPEIDLQVHFVKRSLKSHPWRNTATDAFCARDYRTALGIDWHLVRLAIVDTTSLFVLSAWNEPTMQLIASLLALRRRPFALWTDTPNLTKHRSPAKAALRSSWLIWLFGHASQILATGEPGVRGLIQMGCPPAKAVNFPWFIDLDEYRPQAADAERRDTAHIVRFISSGRVMNSLKGHDIALEAFAAARESTGLDNFTYSIAGTGPDLAGLRQQVERLHLERHVELLGWLEASQLARLFRTSHVLVHPSRFDPFPVAVLEAMSAGMVVLGSDVCGSVQDRIQHEKNGFVHQVGRADQLAEQIALLLKDPTRLPELGARARRTAEMWPVERGVNTIKQLIAGCC